MLILKWEYSFFYITNVTGATALYRACSTGKDKVVKVLLKYGADAAIANKKGKAPLIQSIKDMLIEHMNASTYVLK